LAGWAVCASCSLERDVWRAMRYTPVLMVGLYHRILVYRHDGIVKQKTAEAQIINCKKASVPCVIGSRAYSDRNSPTLSLLSAESWSLTAAPNFPYSVLCNLLPARALEDPHSLERLVRGGPRSSESVLISFTRDGSSPA
jgi:hypothetical protein